jgi:hypothetical protein
MDEMRSIRTELTTLSVFPPGHIAGTLGILRMFCRTNLTIAMDTWNAETAARLIIWPESSTSPSVTDST